LITWIGVGIFVLSACGRPAAGRQVSFMVFGDAAEYAAYEALVAAFEAEQPDIDVVLTHIPSQSEYRTRLAADFAAGTPPDVSLMNYRRYAAFAAAGSLAPVGRYLAESDVISPADFYPLPMDVFTWRGELMCLPQNIASLVVYYNRDLFQAAGVAEPSAGWTWDDFLAAAQALTRDDDGDGRPEQYGLGLEPTLYRLAPFVWANGGRIVDDPAYPAQLGLSRLPSLQAFEWFTALQTVHGVVPDRLAEASLDSETRFMQGTTAMYLNSRRGVPAYREIAGFDWDVAPLPRGVEGAGILHSDGFCLSESAADPDAAWKLIEFAGSVEGQSVLARSGRTVPSNVAVAESPAFLEPATRPANARVFLDELPLLRAVPVLSTWDEIEATADSEIERAFYGDVTPDEAAILARDRTEEYFLIGARP
jgi:multiple sugar transport system substrate-binding protein